MIRNEIIPLCEDSFDTPVRVGIRLTNLLNAVSRLEEVIDEDCILHSVLTEFDNGIRLMLARDQWRCEETGRDKQPWSVRPPKRKTAADRRLQAAIFEAKRLRLQKSERS